MADDRDRLARRDVAPLPPKEPPEAETGVIGSPDPTEEFIEESEAGAGADPTGKDEFTNLRVDEVDTGET